MRTKLDQMDMASDFTQLTILSLLQKIFRISYRANFCSLRSTFEVELRECHPFLYVSSDRVILNVTFYNFRILYTGEILRTN
jgi:hypothetical protein